MNSQEMLSAYKKIKNGGQKNIQKEVQQPNEQYITGDVDFLNEQVFGKYVPLEDEANKTKWTAENGIKMLKQGFTNEQLEKSGLPDYLKESFRKNPSIDVSSAELAMQEVEDKMNARMGGFEASKKIMESLDANDRKSPLNKAYTPTAEQPQPQYQSSGVDYALIKQIVDESITNKLSALKKSLLNEGIGQQGGTVSLVKLGDTFTFLDSDDSIYECKMIYKGRRTTKKKK